MSTDELANAWRVVSMGCAPDALAAALAVEYWDDVPAASEGLPASLAAIAARIQRLLGEVGTNALST